MIKVNRNLFINSIRHLRDISFSRGLLFLGGLHFLDIVF